MIGAAPVLNVSVLEECMAAEFATDQTEAARYLDKVRAYMGRRSLGAIATTLDNFVDYLKEHFPCPEMFGAVMDVGDVEDRCPENYFVEADRMLDLGPCARRWHRRNGGSHCARQDICASESVQQPALRRA